MSSPFETTFNVLTTGATAVAALGTRVSPLRAKQGELPPYAVITVPTTDPITSFDGWSGTDRCEVEITVWSLTLTEADQIARECRAAMDAAGFICLRNGGESFDSQSDPGFNSIGFVFEVWQ